MANLPIKMISGKPKLVEEYDVAGLTVKIDGVRWIVCIEKNDEQKKIWQNVKVSAFKGKAYRKANYWTAWNGERLAGSKDIKIMREFRPELEDAIIDTIMRFA